MTDSSNALTARYAPPNVVDSTSAVHADLPGERTRIVGNENIFQNIGRLPSTWVSRAAIETRNDLKSFFISPQRKLSWQHQVIRIG